MSLKHIILIPAVYLFLAFGTLAHATNLFVPAYFYPSSHSTYWGALATAAQTVNTTAILNPSSGPGTSVDPNYVSAIDKVQRSGGKVIGYIYTNYGDRPLGDVTDEIDRYITFYHVDGFFIDEMTADNIPENIDYYQQIYGSIKLKGTNYSVTGNPGLVPDEAYLSSNPPLVDNLVVFEGSIRSYVNFRPEQWQYGYSKDKFIHIVYNASSTQMKNAFNSSSAHLVGNLYITDDKLRNPYDRLPKYWDSEVQTAATQ